MKKILNYRIILFLAVFLMLGIFIGGFVFRNTILVIVLPLSLLALGSIVSLAVKKWTPMLLLLALSVGLFSFYADYQINYSGDIQEENVLIAARVERTGNGLAVVSDLVIDGEKYQGKARIVTEKEWERGTFVQFYGRVSTYSITPVTDTYAMSRYNDHIYYEIQPNEEYGYSVTQGELKFFEKIMDRMTAPMDRYLSTHDAGLAKSLLFGEVTELSNFDTVVTRGIGIYHIFSVSGLHVGVLIASLLFVLKRLGLNSKFCLIILLPVLVLYGFLTGFPAGVKRASIMAVVSMLSVLLARKNDKLTSLSLSCILILLFNPRELFDLGFIMSVAAMLGICLFYYPIYRRLAKEGCRPIVRTVAGGAALTVSANVFLFPLCLNVFNSFSLYMIVSNLLILPIVTVSFVYLTAVAFATFIFPIFGALYAGVKYPFLAIRVLSTVIYSLPFSVLSVASVGAVAAVYILAMLVLSRFIMLRKPLKLSVVTALSVIGMVLMFLL